MTIDCYAKDGLPDPKTATEPAVCVKPVVRQDIYDHGGSRIWMETDSGRGRNLLADTYGDEDLARRVKACVDYYIKEKYA